MYQLHSEEWEPFDQNWWRDEVVQGRLTRPRAELFLMHWLKLEKLEEVKAHRLFVEFRGLPSLATDLAGTVRRLASDRDLYRACDEHPDDLPAITGGFFQRLETLNQSTPRPLGLQILRAVPGELTPQRASRAFHALDSYMWRRALTRGSTANYNRIMLEVLKAVDHDLAHADDAVIALLANLDGPTVAWPPDDSLLTDLEVRALYGRGRVAQPSVATALRLIENVWRRPRGEGPLGADAELQIEHILPQEWSPQWPVDPAPAETVVEREQNREAHVNRLGNLTLVSPTMNPSLSNRAWAEKRGALREHSNALITTRYLDGDYEGAWDEAAIRTRGGALIDAIISIWPGPDGAFSVPLDH